MKQELHFVLQIYMLQMLIYVNNAVSQNEYSPYFNLLYSLEEIIDRFGGIFGGASEVVTVTSSSPLSFVPCKCTINFMKGSSKAPKVIV